MTRAGFQPAAYAFLADFFSTLFSRQHNPDLTCGPLDGCWSYSSIYGSSDAALKRLSTCQLQSGSFITVRRNDLAAC